MVKGTAVGTVVLSSSWGCYQAMHEHFCLDLLPNCECLPCILELLPTDELPYRISSELLPNCGCFAHAMLSPSASFVRARVLWLAGCRPLDLQDVAVSCYALLYFAVCCCTILLYAVRPRPSRRIFRVADAAVVRLYHAFGSSCSKSGLADTTPLPWGRAVAE